MEKVKAKILIGTLLAALLVVVPASMSRGSSSNQPKKIVLSADNTIVLNDVIDGNSVAAVIQKAKELDQEHGLGRLVSQKKGSSIYLFVRSPGGEIQVGLEMLEALKGLNRPVDTVTMFGASMAFQTVQQLGKRYIVKNGILMSHRAAGEFGGSFGGLRPSPMDNRKGVWESRLDELDAKTVERSGGKQTIESYQKAYNSELWVTGSQAVAQGYADAIVTVQCDESLSGVTTKTVSFMGIPIQYDLDNCPLNSSPMNIRVMVQSNKGPKNLNTFLTEGGEFGSACLIALGTNPNKLCSGDTTLTLERATQVQNQFKPYYDNIQNRIVPYGI